MRTNRADPLLHDVELPLSGTYFAQGFPVEIATNSPAVLEAAAESWGMYAREFDRQPVELRIIVQSHGEFAREPVFRAHRHYFSIVSDSENFAFYDSRTMFGHCFVSEKTVADHSWFRYFFLETIVYMLLTQRYVVPVHAGCVAREGSAMLLCGCSGAGKSTLAFACARAGWTYLTDESSWLLPEGDDGMVIGRPHVARFREDAPRHFPELAGLIAHARPNGKVSIEVPLSAFPGIRTASRCRAGCLVLLDRGGSGGARAEAIPVSGIVDRLIADMPSYGEEVDTLVERATRSLRSLPGYRLSYERLDDAVSILSDLKYS